MTAGVFDSIMTGQVNDASAAISGKLYFSGDKMKGKVLQRLTRDMIRLYTLAKGTATT